MTKQSLSVAIAAEVTNRKNLVAEFQHLQGLIEANRQARKASTAESKKLVEQRKALAPEPKAVAPVPSDTTGFAPHAAAESGLAS